MADMQKLKDRWSSRASAASGDLVDSYVSKSGKLDAARSDAAESNYAAGVQNAVAKKRRQKALGRISEEDLNRGMRDRGGAAYQAAVQSTGDKWANKAAPFVAAAEAAAKGLKPRVQDPMANIDNRVKPVVRAMVETKDKMG